MNVLMSAVEIETRVRELGPWFHNIDIGGVRTAPDHALGDYPRTKWERFAHAIPQDLRGRTVLDVGCNAGFYSLEMKRRGADRVLGVDFDPLYLEQAQFAAEATGLDIEARQMSVYELPQLRERFDVVLFLGVLYRLRHPLLALDILYDHVVDDLLVFQSLMRGTHEEMALEPDYASGETAVFEDPRFPRMHFVEHSFGHDETHWWIPNRACAAAMLRSAGFDVVAEPESEVLVCRRRLYGRDGAPDERGMSA